MLFSYFCIFPECPSWLLLFTKYFRSTCRTAGGFASFLILPIFRLPRPLFSHPAPPQFQPLLTAAAYECAIWFRLAPTLQSYVHMYVYIPAIACRRLRSNNAISCQVANCQAVVASAAPPSFPFPFAVSFGCISTFLRCVLQFDYETSEKMSRKNINLPLLHSAQYFLINSKYF